MTNRKLYNLRIREEALQPESDETTQQRELNKLLGLSTSSSVNEVGTSPGEFSLTGQFRFKYAEISATQIRELADAADIDTITFSKVGEQSQDDGFYVAENTTTARFRPQTQAVSEFDVILVKKGTRESRRFAVETDQYQIDSFFGTNTDIEIGVPSNSTSVFWLSSDFTKRASASPTETRSLEGGNIDIYKFESRPSGYGDNTKLVYNLSYSDVGTVDAQLHDTYNNQEFDSEDIFAWQQVFKSDHEFRGDAVAETGLVRLLFNDEKRFEAETWNDTSESWESFPLPSNNWDLLDFNVITRGLAYIHIQFDFVANGDTTDRSDGDIYSLDAYFHRGWEDVQFEIPDSLSGPVPTDLRNFIDPIASRLIVNPVDTREVIERDEIVV